MCQPLGIMRGLGSKQADPGGVSGPSPNSHSGTSCGCSGLVTQRRQVPHQILMLFAGCDGGMPPSTPHGVSHWEEGSERAQARLPGCGAGRAGRLSITGCVCSGSMLAFLSLGFPTCNSDDTILLQVICWEDEARRMGAARTAAHT